MKNLRQLCAAGVLTLALAASTAAGTMHTGVISPPPPPPDSMTQDRTETAQANGPIYTGVADAEPEADTVTEIALDLLQNVLSLI